MAGDLIPASPASDGRSIRQVLSPKQADLLAPLPSGLSTRRKLPSLYLAFSSSSSMEIFCRRLESVEIRAAAYMFSFSFMGVLMLVYLLFSAWMN